MVGSRKDPDLFLSLQAAMWVMYFAACVDNPRRWHCDCGAHAHHRLMAWNCMESMLTIFHLEVNKCSLSYGPTVPGD